MPLILLRLIDAAVKAFLNTHRLHFGPTRLTA